MSSDLELRCKEMCAQLDLGPGDSVSEVLPLTGGVASDIAKVTIGDRVFCMKFALAKLNVAEDWRAPVHRNRAEYAWLEAAAVVAPEGAVKLFGRSEALHGFAMEFLDGADVYLWKDALLAQAPLQGEAAKVADLVGRVHQASAEASFNRDAFHNRDDFSALRIKPYLSFTAERHPDLAAPMQAMAEQLYHAEKVLVHGDVSPKNILLRKGTPILLDAECATMGDASFDPAFCLNHLVLKALHLPESRQALLGQISAFWAAYRPYIGWEDPDGLEKRVCRLLPMLLLARVDGKSPVEYLSAPMAQMTRKIARELIGAPVDTLATLIEHLTSKTKETIK